jgi:hypothetical protein
VSLSVHVGLKSQPRPVSGKSVLSPVSLIPQYRYAAWAQTHFHLTLTSPAIEPAATVLFDHCGHGLMKAVMDHDKASRPAPSRYVTRDRARDAHRQQGPARVSHFGSWSETGWHLSPVGS